MKILHVVPSYYPAFFYGGPIESVHNLNKWLVEEGIDVTVYTTNANGEDQLANVPFSKEKIVDGVKVFYFPLSFPKKWFYSRSMHKTLKKTIKQFDCVHETSIFLSPSTLVSHIAIKNKIPYIISPRGSLMMEPLKKGKWKKMLYLSAFEKNNLKNAFAIHFTSSLEEKEYYLQKFPIKKSILIPNGFDFQSFSNKVPKGLFRKKYNIPESDSVLLLLSRISWKKGFDTLIPAFAHIHKNFPNSHLVIAGGDGEGYKKTIEEFIMKEKGIKEKIIFTGMLTGDDRISAYQDADIFVLPSYAENFANSILEAAYFALPIITTPEVGLAEIIKKNEAGIITEKNIEKFSEAISFLLKNKKKSIDMGKNGEHMVYHNFSKKTVAQKWIQEYGKIIKNE